MPHFNRMHVFDFWSPRTSNDVFQDGLFNRKRCPWKPNRDFKPLLHLLRSDQLLPKSNPLELRTPHFQAAGPRGNEPVTSPSSYLGCDQYGATKAIGPRRRSRNQMDVFPSMWLPTREACKYLACSRATLYRLIGSGDLVMIGPAGRGCYPLPVARMPSA